MMRNFSNFIQDHIRRRGVSLRRLALESGVSPSTFSRWLRGQQRPSPASCQKLAEYLSVPAEQVLIIAGYLMPLHTMDANSLPEFREYAYQKYPEDLDEDMITMIEDLIHRRRSRREEVS